MKLAILALEGCMQSAVTGITDLLALANHVLRLRGAKARFTSQRLSLDGRAVRASGGLLLPVDGAASRRGSWDAIIVPGSLVDRGTGERLQRHYDRAGGWLRQQHAHGRIIGASCSGVFLLGAAGLLDGRRATITWWLQSELMRRYPQVELAGDAVVTTADRIVCAAGPMSWVDLLFRIIEIVEGDDVAKICSDYAVIDTIQRTQAIYRPLAQPDAEDRLLADADMLVRRIGKTPMTVSGLADALGMSERTLNRRFQELAHEPPLSFIMRRRIDHARTLLETTNQSIKLIARSVGYRDESSFRRNFRRLTLMSPQAYRARWSSREASA